MVPAELYGLQLNQDISEALIIGTANQLHPVSSAVASVSIAGVDLRTLADKMKVLGVVLDQRLTFAKHVMAVARSCNYHTQAIRHICHLLSTDLATTLACSLILSRLDYCNSLLHGWLRLAVYRHYTVCRIMQPGSLNRLRGDHMHGRYCVNCTGCQFITELITSWL